MSKLRRRKFNLHDKELLLAETDNVCPVCGRRLLDEKGGKAVAQFEIAHIYPHSATDQQKKVLEGINPPSDIEALDNLIALCRECHKRYDSFTTRDDYLKMATLKIERRGRYEATVELSHIGIEADILEVLKDLETMDSKEFCALSMDPVPIKKKIPSGPLQIKAIALATQYYGFLRNQFQCMDRKRMGKFDMIAQQIKMAALKAGQESLIQDDIFNAIVRWMFDKTNASRSSCEVVVAFFIQNCEVFSAASQ